MLYAFHVADPAVSGFDCASDCEGAAARLRVERDALRAKRDGSTPGSICAPRQQDAASELHLSSRFLRASLAAIAQESSESERRAADAERELVEWKKIKFMRDRVGESFSGMILNATKYGLFVELDDLFVEGLVPLQKPGNAGRRPVHVSGEHAADHRGALGAKVFGGRAGAGGAGSRGCGGEAAAVFDPRRGASRKTGSWRKGKGKQALREEKRAKAARKKRRRRRGRARRRGSIGRRRRAAEEEKKR